MYRTLNLVLVLAIIGWTALSIGSLLYHSRDAKQRIEQIAHETARESIEKDLLYRYWAAQQGGVYVPVSDHTPPNPYLAFANERDVTTSSGRRLTLVNPAYMTRQVHELGRTFTAVQGHVTSLKPIRPDNAPDPWEAKALRFIEAGAKEYGAIEEYQGAQYYRLMYPLYVEEPCLTCHSAQGYKLGDIRGGISASIPMAVFAGVSRGHMVSEAKHFGGIWLLGIAGIAVGTSFVRRRIGEREAAALAVKESEQRLRSLVNSAPFGAHLYRLERDGRLVFTGANAAADRILGVENQQFIGRTIEEAFPALPADVQAAYRRAAETGLPTELDHVTYNQKMISGVFEMHAVQTAPRQVAVFFRDTTEKYKAELALKESEERYRTIVSTAREGIVAIDAQENITYVNERLASLLGYRPDAMIGLPIAEFMHPDEHGAHRQELALRRKGLATQYERRFVHRDGHSIMMSVSASPLLDEQNLFLGSFGMVTDISERVEMEAMLAASERQLRVIFDTMQAGIILVDPHGIITFANRRMAEMFKLPLEQLIGSAYPEHVHPDQRQDGDQRMRQLITGEIDAVSLERHYMTADGHDFWGYLSGRRLEDEEGNLVSLVGIIADITEHKNAEDNLRSNWRFTQSIIENEPECVKILGPGGILQYMNPAGLAMIEVDRLEQVLGQPVQMIVVPEHRDAFVDLTERVFRGERGTLEFEIVGLRGSRRWLETHAVPLMDGAGRVEKLLGLTSDITLRKRASEALRDSEERYRTIVNTANEGIMTLDCENVITFVNDRMVEMLGYEKGELPGRSVLDFIHPEDHEEHRGQMELRKKDLGAQYERRFVHKNGSIMRMIISDAPLRDRNGSFIGAFGMFTDITERTHVEEQRMKLEQQLLQSQKIESVGRLAGGIAHDINNMLTPILGYADMLGFRLPQGDPGKADLGEIVSAANRVKDMTQQLLAFARKQTLDMRPLDVNVVISRFSKMLRRTLREDIKISLTLAPSVGTVLADERQIEQVILNLAVNAQDAMPSGGVLMISTKDQVLDRSFVETRPGSLPGRHLLIKVVDTGMGMDSETRSRLFEPFFTTKESGKGTGLGLATVYGIIKQHKGYIEVESAPRQGATFSLYLPVTDDGIGDDAFSFPGGVRRGTETILVVEDQGDVLRIVQQLLEMLGYRVLAASDGDDALDALRANGPSADLLITDVIMPGCNGKELYDRLKREYPPLKVLYMSGYPADVISTHGVLDKDVHFLRKPFSAQELSAKVREVIDDTASSDA